MEDEVWRCEGQWSHSSCLNSWFALHIIWKWATLTFLCKFQSPCVKAHVRLSLFVCANMHAFPCVVSACVCVHACGCNTPCWWNKTCTISATQLYTIKRLQHFTELHKLSYAAFWRNFLLFVSSCLISDIINKKNIF